MSASYSWTPIAKLNIESTNAMSARTYIPAGTIFTRLTVRGIGPDKIRKSGKRGSASLCDCECGKQVVALNKTLLNGKTRSCGCLHMDVLSVIKRRHGETVGGFTKEYKIWRGIKWRCCNPKHPNFMFYGGRGIKVCGRWLNSFVNFRADMGRCPPGMEIDRWPDNDGNYEPSNCRWATKEQQANNRRTNRRITHDGKTQTYAQWEKEIGLKEGTITQRIARGWSESRALSPVQ